MKVSGNNRLMTAAEINTSHAGSLPSEAPKEEKKEDLIRIDISEEGKEQYRKSLSANVKMGLEDAQAQKNIIKHLSMDSNFETRFHSESNKMLAEARGNGTEASIQDKAENYFVSYAKMYDEIVQGYDNGTRETYVSENGTFRKLTKEEELSELDKAYGKIAGDFEKREKINHNAHNIIEEGFKKFAPYRKAKADSTVAASEKKAKSGSTTTTNEKESRETNGNIIEGISKKMINAANLFKAGYGKSDMATLLAGIKIFG